MSCFCLPPTSLYVIYLLLEHRLFPPAPKQTEEQPQVRGAHVPLNGRKARATPLRQGPCYIANRVIQHLLKSARSLSPVSVGIILGGGQSYVAESCQALSPGTSARGGCSASPRPASNPGWPQPEPLSGLGSPSLQVLSKLRAFIGYLNQVWEAI